MDFAAMGFAVFSINYRLAPKHPFPAAVEDSALALTWLAANADEYGADLQRLVYGGESAGGNLVSGLTLAGCWQLDDPLARRVWELARPKAVLLACGLLQVSAGERYLENESSLGGYEGESRSSARAIFPRVRKGRSEGLGRPLRLPRGGSRTRASSPSHLRALRRHGSYPR